MKKLFFLLLITNYSLLIVEAQWTQTSASATDAVYAMLSYGDTIFAGTGSGCIKTINNGTTWSSSSSNSFRSFTATGNYVFGGTQSAGVYVTTNGGLNWTQMNSGLTASYVRGMTSSGAYVFAGTTTAGVFLTTNYGVNWTQMNSGLNNNYVFSMLVNGTTTYAGTGPGNGGVYKSTDYGSNWGYSGLVNDFVYALVSKGTIVFAGGDITGVYRSTNGGGTWTQVNSGLSNLFVNSMLVYNNFVLAGTQGGLYISSNDGASWTLFNQGLPANWIYGLALNSPYMFAGLYNAGGIWRRPLSDLTGIQPAGNDVPENFHLYQNYPNPFNPVTRIKFDIPNPLLGGVSAGRGGFVRLTIYDLLGREVAVLVNEQLKPGTYEIEWDGTNHPSGVYYYTLIAGDGAFSATRKMILVK